MWFAFENAKLGRVAIAGTGSVIHAIRLGDNDDALHGELRHMFPGAASTTTETTDQATVERVIAVVNGADDGAGLEFDLKGTEMQRKVWNALRNIPAGQTVTYAELAGMIGQQKAVRAVANACGANPVAIAIPCHRVVRTDGGLGGYCWGLERKKALLAREAKAA